VQYNVHINTQKRTHYYEIVQRNSKTRMVQLPATAAIEYVAACWVSGAGGFLSGVLSSGGWGLLPGGTFVRGAYARSPSVRIRTV